MINESLCGSFLFLIGVFITIMKGFNSLKLLKLGLVLGIVLAFVLFATPADALTSSDVNIWWPANEVWVSGNQPFKALVQNHSVNQYQMFWQVDGGQWNWMPDSYQDYPHKETWVNLTGWTWKGQGPYTVNFIVADWNGSKLGEKSIRVYNSSVSATATPTPSPTSQVTIQVSASSSNPLSGNKLYVNPHSEPKKWADANRWSRPNEASLMDKIANQAEVQWFGNWNWNLWNDVNGTTNTITNSGALPVFVAYNIPQRDCGGYSAGGSGSPDAYRSWIKTFADAIGTKKAAVIVEPDALAGMDCLSWNDQKTRVELIKNAVQALKSKGNIKVYIDSGHPGWKSAETMADRLKQAGIGEADGFALNISNFHTNESIKNYGSKISSLVGGKHFVADTGRNGNGPASNNEWCNPWGRALGTPPTTNTDHSLVDAYLWVRGPSGSDGWCNGGPSAGTFWPEYGLDLAKNTRW